MYVFRVQGEEYEPGLIRLWIPATLARELSLLAGGLEPEKVYAYICQTLDRCEQGEPRAAVSTELAAPIVISREAYQMLQTTFPYAASDADMIQLLVELPR